MQASVIIAILGIIALASVLAAPRRVTVDGFFRGSDTEGHAPGL